MKKFLQSFLIVLMVLGWSFSAHATTTYSLMRRTSGSNTSIEPSPQTQFYATDGTFANYSPAPMPVNQTPVNAAFSQNLATAALSYTPSVTGSAHVVSVQLSADANLTGDTVDIKYCGVSQIQPVLGAINATGNTTFSWWPDFDMVIDSTHALNISCSNSAAGNVTGNFTYKQ